MFLFKVKQKKLNIFNSEVSNKINWCSDFIVASNIPTMAELNFAN